MYFRHAAKRERANEKSEGNIATLAALPDGRAGTVETLRIMRNMARNAVRSPTQEIRHLALSLIAILPARRWGAEVEALHAFVRDDIRYARDPVGIESVATPEKTLQLRAGDCDDKSTLLAAMLESIGHPSRFVAVGFNGGNFSHVYVESKIGSAWVPLETIIPKPMGWSPPDATSRYILKV